MGAGSDKSILLTRLCNDIKVPLAAKILHRDTEAMHIVASLAGEVPASCNSLQNNRRDCRFEVTLFIRIAALLHLSSGHTDAVDSRITSEITGGDTTPSHKCSIESITKGQILASE